jgi:hypothetical protein
MRRLPFPLNRIVLLILIPVFWIWLLKQFRDLAPSTTSLPSEYRWKKFAYLLSLIFLPVLWVTAVLSVMGEQLPLSSPSLTAWVSCDLSKAYVHKREWTQLETALAQLRSRHSETKLVAANLPMFVEDVVKICRLSAGEARALRDRVAGEVRWSSRAADLPLPDVFLKVPERCRFQQTSEWLQLSTEMRAMEGAIRQVEQLKRQRQACRR